MCQICTWIPNRSDFTFVEHTKKCIIEKYRQSGKKVKYLRNSGQEWVCTTVKTDCKRVRFKRCDIWARVVFERRRADVAKKKGPMEAIRHRKHLANGQNGYTDKLYYCMMYDDKYIYTYYMDGSHVWIVFRAKVSDQFLIIWHLWLNINRFDIMTSFK